MAQFMKMTGLINIRKVTGLFLANPKLFKVFLGTLVLAVSGSTSTKATNYNSRNERGVKICRPVLFSTFVKMTPINTVHFSPEL